MPVINPKTGREFRWERGKWTPRTRARWHKKTTNGQPVIGSVRAIAHLDWMNRRAKKIFGVGIEVIQSAYNTTVAASAGTHNEDLVYDLYIPGVPWWRQQRFFRRHGFWCWYRHWPLFGNHIHGFCALPGQLGSPVFANRGFKVGVYVDGGYSTRGTRVTSSQLDDFVKKAFGLSGQHEPGSDRSWFPPDLQATVFDLHAYVQRRKRHQAAA